METARGIRVAFIAGTLGTGGAEKQLVYMARSLQSVGVRAAVFSMGNDDEHHAKRLREAGIELWAAGRPRARVVRLVRLLGALRRFRPDIIQASHFYVSAYAVIAGWVLRCPVLGAVRSDLRVALKSIRFLGPWLFGLPTAVVVNSQAAVASARGLGLDATRIRLVTNVVDTSDVGDLPPESASDGRVTAIVVANLVRVKRLDRFVDALWQSRASCPALRGLIVGGGPLALELEAQASARGLDSDALVFAGPREGIHDLLASASFLCLTSSAEGTPNVVLEAMAMARPVVVMDAGDAARIVEDGVTGYVVPQGDVDLFVERMVRLANDRALRARMGCAGRARVEHEFSPSTLAGQLVRVYRDLAARGGNQELIARLNQIKTD